MRAIENFINVKEGDKVKYEGLIYTVKGKSSPKIRRKNLHIILTNDLRGEAFLGPAMLTQVQPIAGTLEEQEYQWFVDERLLNRYVFVANVGDIDLFAENGDIVLFAENGFTIKDTGVMENKNWEG